MTSVPVSHSYDNIYRLTSVTFPGSRTVSYGYDNANRLTSVTDWNSNATAYAYDDAGRMTTSTLPSGTGVVSAYSYDNADRLTGISHVKGASTTVASVAYTLDDVGNRTQRVDQQGTHTYAYDDLYRLTSVTYPSPATTSYAFDAFGNRTSMTVSGNATTYDYDDADRLTEVTPPSPASAISYTWDDNGNLTDRGSDSFAWDYEDRMVEATVNSVTTTFAYRGDGLRDSRAVSGGATTTFAWDIAGGLPVVLDDGNQYVYGAGLTSMKQGGNWYYYLADGLGSTMAIVDSSGTSQKSYTYDVYGEATPSGGLANEFDFAGQQTDGTGLQYLRARYYDPETGTFLSREPLAMSPMWLGAHHAYAEASPVSLVDPTGLDSIIPGSGGTCLFGIGICKKDPGPPPPVSSLCAGFNAFPSPECAEQGEALDKWLDEQLVGIAALIGEYLALTPSGEGPRKLTGFTRHGLNQTISREGHGVSNAAIPEAVKHGTVTKTIRGGRVAYEYVGKNAKIVLNASGKVVTAIATSSKGHRY